MAAPKDITIVVSEFAPPQIGGTASVLYELLRHFPQESLVLATRRKASDEPVDDRCLRVPTIYVGIPRNQLSRSWIRPFRVARMITDVIRDLRQMRKKPRNIFAVFPSIDFLLVSIGLSRMLNIPLYVYLNDCLEDVAISKYDIVSTRFAARIVFGRGTKVYAMSELMERHYKERGYKIEALPHGVDVTLTRHPKPQRDAIRTKIGFAGEVYETNDSAIADLVMAKDILKGEIELHFALTRRSREWLDKLGILGSIDSTTGFETHEGLLDFLSTCDILFVPMNFESIFSKDLRTIFPTKVTDYWLAQRPMLVYGPREYAFVVKAVEDGYAVAVSEKGPERLAKAVSEIMGAPELRNDLVSKSRYMIEMHNSVRIARRLMADLGIDKS